jgi:hypothetical protein
MNKRLMSYGLMTAGILLGPVTVLAGQATGDLWQVTPQMQMGTMTMPLPPQQVCSARQWTSPPAGRGPDATCVNSNFTMTSTTTATWTIACQNPPSTGTGEITRMGADAWTGAINYNSAQGQMTINLSATRVGECNNPS